MGDCRSKGLVVTGVTRGGGDATYIEVLEPEVIDWLGPLPSPPASGKWLISQRSGALG